MGREVFFGELADLDVVPAQPGEVFHKYGGDIARFNRLEHFLEAGPFYRRARDPIVHKKDRVGVALFLGDLLENFF